MMIVFRNFHLQVYSIDRNFKLINECIMHSVKKLAPLTFRSALTLGDRVRCTWQCQGICASTQYSFHGISSHISGSSSISHILLHDIPSYVYRAGKLNSTMREDFMTLDISYSHRERTMIYVNPDGIADSNIPHMRASYISLYM